MTAPTAPTKELVQAVTDALVAHFDGQSKEDGLWEIAGDILSRCPAADDQTIEKAICIAASFIAANTLRQLPLMEEAAQ